MPCTLSLGMHWCLTAGTPYSASTQAQTVNSRSQRGEPCFHGRAGGWKSHAPSSTGAKELSWWDARWKKGDQRAVQRRHDHARTCRTGVGGQMSVKGKHEAAKPPDKAQEDTAPPAATAAVCMHKSDGSDRGVLAAAFTPPRSAMHSLLDELRCRAAQRTHQSRRWRLGVL